MVEHVEIWPHIGILCGKKWIRVIPDDLEWFSIEWEKQNTKMCILYKLIFLVKQWPMKGYVCIYMYIHICVCECACVWFPGDSQTVKNPPAMQEIWI